LATQPSELRDSSASAIGARSSDSFHALLPTRALGDTDMRITRVGFGAWAIGGPEWAAGWGSQSDADSVAVVRHAVERGINWIDTAPIYGLGHSENIVRRALQGISVERRPLIFTKCGLAWDEADRKALPGRVGAPQTLRREVEDSLRRLGVDRIDLYQMHMPPEDGTPLEDYWQTLLDLKREGKVRAIGLSNHSGVQLAAAERVGHVDTLQNPLSLINREPAALLPRCEANRTGVLVYSPMQSGLLSGRFTPERAAALSSDDWRSRSPEFSGRRLVRNLSLVDALRPIAERLGSTVGAVAIAWTLAWPGVTGAIVGARRPQQIEGWIGAATLELDTADLRDIAAALQRTGAGRGAVLPSAAPQ
jgi:aryl-alcohol dehydrogenase-like predicted oxidoreductase